MLLYLQDRPKGPGWYDKDRNLKVCGFMKVFFSGANPKSKNWQVFLTARNILLLLLLVFCLSASAEAFTTLAEQPQMDREELFKPLVDTSRNAEPQAQPYAPLQGSAQKQGQIPVHDSPSSSKVLTGQVQTLQQAIESEKDAVNWYAWYLAARQYISQTGGLRCALGTPIKFYRNGKMEALTYETSCIGSVIGKRFPLPGNTKLDALILPVRPGQGPPASPDEIYSRIPNRYN